ncbi:MAG: hypothetical protein AMXMBFR4_02690 [Candidatus Hydrogenedentota bacterium]
MKLPAPIATAVQPLFDAYPLDQALNQLVVARGASLGHLALVEDIVKDPAVAARPELCAGLWLYVDELDRSHVISQNINNATGSFWHGIMHRREGDFGNSHYWFNRVGEHPAMKRIEDYDPHEFIDAVEARHRKSPRDLIELQRREWNALFAWCASRPAPS